MGMAFRRPCFYGECDRCEGYEVYGGEGLHRGESSESVSAFHGKQEFAVVDETSEEIDEQGRVEA